MLLLLLVVAEIEVLIRFYVLHNLGNPNIQTVDGETPLHIAASWNRQFIVEMLLVIKLHI